MPEATVLIPTYNHGPLLQFSLASAQEQTIQDIEIFIVGDGVPDITRQLVADRMAKDKRIRFFDNPKGPRHGEIYRNAALEQASGRIVCYLADDDLWFPHHIESMRRLLEKADFAWGTLIEITVTGRPSMRLSGDLSDPWTRKWYLSSKENTLPIFLAISAHTLEAFKRFRFQWRTTPPGYYTDDYMWRQVLSQPDCRAAHGNQLTALRFDSGARKNWTLEQRGTELARWRSKLAAPEERERIYSEAFACAMEGQIVGAQTLRRGGLFLMGQLARNLFRPLARWAGRLLGR